MKELDKQIEEKYIEYILEKKNQPSSVFTFCKWIGLDEKEFYNSYSAFEQIDLEIWSGFIDKTLDKLLGDKTYHTFTSREKLLSFYYTLIEILKEKRSYVQYFVNRNRQFGPLGQHFRKLKEKFNVFIKELIKSGLVEGEIEDRKMLSDKYYLGFWLQLIFILDFWVKDISNNFENTDAAIEKSVNLYFDWLGKNPVDSLFDFGKFVFQTRVF